MNKLFIKYEYKRSMKGLKDLVPLYQRRLVDIQDHPEWDILKKTETHAKYHGGLKKGAQTWSADGSSQGHTI